MKLFWRNNGDLRAPHDDDKGYGGVFDDDVDDLEDDVDDIDDDDDDDVDDDADDDDDDIDDDIDDDGDDVPGARRPKKRAKESFASLSPAQIKALIETSVAAGKPKEAPRQYTQDELDVLLKKPKITADRIKKLFGPDVSEEDKATALTEMLSEAAQHATAVAGYAITDLKTNFERRAAALEATQHEAKLKEFQRALTHEYPALKGREPLVLQALTELNNEGYVAPSKRDAQRVVAARVQRIVRSIDPAFRVGRKKANAGMVRSGRGGGRSSGRSSGSSGKSWAGIFD